MKPLLRSFAALIPLLALVVSMALVLGLTFLHLYTLKHAAHGSDTASLGTTEYRFVIPADSFLRFAFMSATLRAQKPVTILNVPAHFAPRLISYLIARDPSWSPSFLGPAAWCCICYPFLALPAWFYVGFGIDAFVGRTHVRTGNMVLSVILVLTFGTIAAVLQFGLGQGPGLIPGYREGFALWTLLSAIPLAAWLRQRFAKQSQ